MQAHVTYSHSIYDMMAYLWQNCDFGPEIVQTDVVYLHSIRDMMAYLWQNCDFGSEIMQAHVTYSHSIYDMMAYLWQNCDFGPEIVQTDVVYSHSIYDDATPCCFNQAEQCQGHGWLPCTCPSHNSYLQEHNQMVAMLAKLNICIDVLYTITLYQN